MNIIEKPLSELHMYANNPRNNEDAVPKVMESIRRFGFRVPIIIDAKNTIICGHTRARACEKLNIKTVPCIVADDLTEEQIRAFRLADNKVAEYTYWDNDKLIEEIEQISSIDMKELFGFFDGEAQSLDNLMEQPENIDDFFTDAPPKEAEENQDIKVTVIVADEDEYGKLENFLNENGMRYRRE